MWRGGLSYRRLWSLVQYLPQESWTQTILRDKQLEELVNPASEQPAGPQKFGPWALVNYQIASLTDAINQLRYVTAIAGRLEGVDKPEPTPRPGLERRVRMQSDAAVLYLDRLRARG